MQLNSIKKKDNNIQYFLIDATNKTLGRLASKISLLLQGKIYKTYSSVNKNYIIIINAEKIAISGKKLYDKLYYKPTQRPGNLKSESFIHLKYRFPEIIIKKAVIGMLPKNKVSQILLKRLYIYSNKNNELYNISSNLTKKI